MSAGDTLIRFAEFEANLDTGELRRGGADVRVQDLPFRLLAALVEHPGQLVTRAELGKRLWSGDTFVDFDAGLNTAVAKLREALGDSSESPRFLETVPKRGYRFIAPVERSSVARSAAPPVADASAAVSTTPVAASAARGDVPPLATARRGGPGATGVAAALVVAVAGLVAIAAWQVRAARAPVRVAVVLFDNETGDAAFDRLAQVLTDSTVVRLTANDRLAVIGNAAVLRSERPFRDLELIRESVDADLIVIGQVQRVDNAVRALTHLIRASDQAHVWVKPTPLSSDGEAAFESAVAGAIAAAVSSETTTPARK
jgi:DNA-binding winged helix-turn-helix (wHTH) protein/TolB-like protein